MKTRKIALLSLTIAQAMGQFAKYNIGIAPSQNQAPTKKNGCRPMLKQNKRAEAKRRG